MDDHSDMNNEDTQTIFDRFKGQQLFKAITLHVTVQLFYLLAAVLVFGGFNAIYTFGFERLFSGLFLSAIAWLVAIGSVHIGIAIRDEYDYYFS